MPRKQARRTSGYELRNFYESKEVQALQPEYVNPHFNVHGLKVPFRMVICAASGGGKSNLLMNILSVTTGTFNDVYLFCRDLSEPLYEHLANSMTNRRTGKINPHVHLHEGLDELNGWDLKTHFAEHGQTLAVFDDMINSNQQQSIQELFIRGRKMGTGGISLIYLTQSWYKVPKIIRLQANYVILRKIQSTRDLNMLLKDTSLGMSSEELIALYEHCVGNSITDFLFIDLENSEKPFRKNLSGEIC
jgi:hypothetical protein